MGLTFQPEEREVTYEITATARIEGVALPFRFRIKTRDWDELAQSFNAWGEVIDTKLDRLSGDED